MKTILNFKNESIYLLITLLSAIILIPFTGNVHLFDWDEINFAECAREMIVTNSYHTVLLNYQPFWEKPPLFIWMQVISMKIFGINEFAARFPNILNGIFTLITLYYFGKKWYSKTFGIVWAVIHLGTPLPHLYFRSGIIDPWYNLFGFIAFVGIIEWIQNYSLKWAVIAGISLGLAVLTKGPAMVLIVFLSTIFLIFKNFSRLNKNSVFAVILFSTVFVFIGGSWFIYEYIWGNKEIISAFIDYQIRLFQTEDSGHSGFFLYHFVVLLIGCFPSSIAALGYFSKNIKKDIYSFSMMVLLLVVLILFSIVKTKIVHYSSLSYYSISFLVTYVIVQMDKFQQWQKYLHFILAFIIGLVLILASTIEHWKVFVIPYLETTDKFAAENLKVNVKWYNYEFLLGIALWLICYWYLFKKKFSIQTHLSFYLIMIMWICATINSFVGKVEQYTQASAIHFFQYCGEKNYPVDTYGYKSYAYLFYGNRKPLNEIEKQEVERYWENLQNAGYEKIFSYNLAYLNWLMYDDNKYPVYIVSKIQDEENVLKTGRFKKLYSRGGYVFFMKQR
jgi:hypothetical protein